MKKQALLFVVFLIGIVVCPQGKLKAGNEFSGQDNEQRLSTQLPSERSFQETNTQENWLRAVGGGGIDTGDGGNKDPEGTRNDAPIGQGEWILLVLTSLFLGIKFRQNIKIRESDEKRKE